MKACLLSALLLLPTLQVSAGDILVNSASDADLRSAIDGANSGDVITFAPALSNQTISLTGGQLVINVNLTIDASNLAERLTVSGGDLSRVFLVNGFHDVLLKGFNVTSGQSPVGEDGGGIYNDGGTLTLVNMSVSGNATGRGIDLQSPSDPGGHGGGIYNNAGTLTVANSTIANNTTGRGGNPGNPGIDPGGAGGSGGGIWNEVGTVIVENSTISGNQCGPGVNGITGGVGGSGGGVYNSGGYVIIRNATIVGNSTGDTGGPGTPGGYGGGIYQQTGTVELANTIVAQNSLGNGGGATSTGPDFHPGAGTVIAGGVNLVGNNDRVDAFFPAPMTGGEPNENGDLVGTDGDPLDPLLGAVTVPLPAFVPQPGSPVIDAGDNSFLSQDGLDLDGDGNFGEQVPVDQLGRDRTSGKAVDLGAVEDQSANLAKVALLKKQIQVLKTRVKKAKSVKDKRALKKLLRKLRSLKKQLQQA
ncbi:MAG: hypothetical protein KDN18_06700 [Verrucomicrobiae bacterium]|nr:hypothetical protein [Verrucomicrobiae bacterium]